MPSFAPNLKHRLKSDLHLHKPDLRFKRHLDPPWDNGLGTSIKITSCLVLLNTTLILLLGVLSVASTDLGADTRKQDQDYISKHALLLKAELVFFYLTTPLVYVATNVTENLVLWDDRLRPLYVICAAVIAINVWILQLTLWGPCMFAASSIGGGLNGPGYCPYLFKNHGVELGKMQTVGSPRVVFFCVPSLFILYMANLFFGIKAFRRERRPPAKAESYNMASPYSGSGTQSEPESLPFRMSWVGRNSPPKSGKSSPDRESLMSPMTRKEKPVNDAEEDGETTPSLRAEPAIALLLTTPHGTTEEQNPFDSDRLSQLGHRTN